MNMLIRKLRCQDSKFRMFCIICLSSLLFSYFLFAMPITRIQFGFINIYFSSDTSNTKNVQCVIPECSMEQSQKYGDLFASFHAQWSGCYGDFYLKAFDDHDTPVEVLIDVGANKAYAVATWFAFFLPELDINQARLGEYIRSAKGLAEACGSCNDCLDKPLTKKNMQQKMNLQIHAFEPQPGTVDVLKDIQKWMNVSERSDVVLKIHGMAVGDKTGQALFKKCNAGNEVCSLDVSGASTAEQVYVNITTLDDFINQNHLPKIDILKIDTEGYEPLVFRGAKQLLQEHRIRLFIFEHLRGGGVWLNTSLQIEVSNLLKLGYVCYIIGKDGVLRVSNCWNEKFNARHNNLLCVSSKDKRLMDNIDQMRLSESRATTCGTISKR